MFKEYGLNAQTNAIWVKKTLHCSFRYNCDKCLPIFTARSSYASAVLGIGILSVSLSVCPSVCHTLALWRNEKRTAEILTPHEREINFVFWHQKRLVGDVPFHLKFALKMAHPLEKRRLRPISAYDVWTVRTSETCSIIANRKLTTRFPTSYRWNADVTPNSPKGWLKKQICHF